MVPCGSCSRHVRRDDAECPHCGRPTLLEGMRLRAAGALLLGLMACNDGQGPGDQALYGDVDTNQLDEDGDGFTPADGDCDDADDTRHPDATETAGDGVDSNCDGDDDT